MLDVPSVIVPVERNYLLNPQHRTFGEISIAPLEPFALMLGYSCARASILSVHAQCWVTCNAANRN